MKKSIRSRIVPYAVAAIVIVILWAIAQPNYIMVRSKAREAERKSLASMNLPSGADKKPYGGPGGGGGPSAPAYAPRYDESAREMNASGGLAAPAAAPEPPSPPGQGVAYAADMERLAAAAGRKMIYSDDITIRVKQYGKSKDDVMALTTKFGGYISSSQESTAPEVPAQGTITVRVPASKFQDFLVELRKVGVVLNERLTGDDVTKEYVDLQAQINAKQIERGRLLDLLNRTARLSDLLTVEQEVTRVQTELDQLTGRVSEMSNMIALSTATITLGEEVQAPPTKFEWGVGRVAKAAFGALLSTARGIGNAAVWLVIFVIPVVAVIALVLWLLIKGVIWLGFPRKKTYPPQP
jgi:hypothetical protein